MGRPSKQKEAVIKYFKKSLTKRGKSEYFECTFCLQSFAYNSWRMAKHLITCTKTTALFKNSDLPIIKKLFSQNTNNEESTSVQQNYYENYQSIIDNEGLINDNLPSPTRPNTSLSNYSFLSNSNSINNNNIIITNSTQSSSSNSIRLDRFVDCIINDKKQDDIWTALARACYASETPLSFTENSYWIDAFKKIKPSLQLPNRYQLSNNLLNKEHKLIETIVNDKISSSKFLSIQIDGWSNIRYEPVVNIVLTTPEPVVYKIIDTGTNKHSATYMAKIIQEVIDEIGYEKIISIISDNAKNMIESWEIVNEHYPELDISFYCCGVHVLNLLCKDFVKLSTFKDIQTYTKGIIKEFKYSDFLKGLLNEFKKDEKESNHSQETVCLKSHVAIRLGSETESLKSLLKNKQYLKQVAISSRATNLLSETSIEKILNDKFWDQIDMALNLIEPISKWITILKGDCSNLSQVCIAFHSIQMHLNETLLQSFLTKEEKNLIIQKFDKRKSMALKKIHFAAHLLDGRNKGKCLNNSECIDAVEFISSLSTRMNLNIPDILSELAMYRTCEGLWSKKFIWDSLKKRSDGTQIGLLTWWKGICSSSILSQIAIAIFSCPPTSASATTGHSLSTYGFIHTAKQNCLTDEQAAKLVYVKHNLKLNDFPNQAKIGVSDDFIEFQMSEVDEEVNLCLSESEDNEVN